LEALKSELEDSTESTTAAHDLRNKREMEVVQLKKIIDDEARAHETALLELRQRHAHQIEQVNEQVDQAKKVFIYTFDSSTDNISISFRLEFI